MNILNTKKVNFTKNKDSEIIYLNGEINLQRISEFYHGSVVKLNHEIDQNNISNYRESFDHEIVKQRKLKKYDLTKKIYADFSSIKSINSLGVVTIIQTHKLALMLGVEFIIHKPTKMIMKILNSTGIKLNYSHNLGT